MDLDDNELEATRKRKCTEMKCKYCKYFEKNEDLKFYGDCTNENMIYDTAYCYEKLKERDNEEIQKNKLFYMDYESYNAGIEVGEEFGCIHFENL